MGVKEGLFPSKEVLRLAGGFLIILIVEMIIVFTLINLEVKL